MKKVILGLGTNLGDRTANMLGMVQMCAGVLVAPVKLSRTMETEPLGMAPGAPWFLNRLISGGYPGNAGELLLACKTIEQALGRSRMEKGALPFSRTADIDILLFGDTIINMPDIVVPHPGIRKRRFCLEGLNDIVPDRTIPGTGKTAAQMLAEMTEPVRSQIVRFIHD